MHDCMVERLEPQVSQPFCFHNSKYVYLSVQEPWIALRDELEGLGLVVHPHRRLQGYTEVRDLKARMIDAGV
jgi:hypothetical protein